MGWPLLVGLGVGVAHADPVTDAVGFLSNSQAATGGWGTPSGTGFRDTTVVVETLKAINRTGATYTKGVDYLDTALAPNQDYLARQITALTGADRDVSARLATLEAGQAAEDPNSARPNFPEGGWGLAPGFGTDALTTALAVTALRTGGRPKGLTIVGAVVQTGAPNSHPFDFPAGASGLVIRVRQVTGTVRLFVDTPSAGTFFIDVTGPANLTGLPEQAGRYTLRVESRVGSPNTYSLDAGFVIGGFDVARVSRALRYLALAQNADGGWGVARGGDTSFMVTAEVVASLGGYGTNFGPRTVTDRGAAWLESHQNPDGGLGSNPGTSTVYETALAVRALRVAKPSSTAISNATTYLRGRQLGNGSWSNDPYQTALAVTTAALCGDGVIDSGEQCDPPGQCCTATCQLVANGTSCSDSDACTQVDTCQAGVCVGSSPVVCAALDQCHGVGTCDPATGRCSDPAKPDFTPCDDGKACTQDDTCQAGVCVGSSSIGCGPPKTFTVPPCRVLDTRISVPLGPIPANGTRSILVTGDLTGAHQGGAGNCGVPEGATAVYVNVVAVNAGGPGHLTVYPYGTSLPLASTLNFTTGQTIANGVLVPICTPAASCDFDLSITMGPAGAHLVVDVTGYLLPLP